MKSRHLTALAILSTVVAMISVCYMFAFILRFPGYRGPVYDSWGGANGTFQMRMTAYREVGIIMPGAFFTIESALMGSNEWREVKGFRGDDPVPVRVFSERFRFVNPNTAYFYTGDEFWLTQDSGRTWCAWHPVFPGSDGKPADWAIRKAHVESDGSGKAWLSRFDDQKRAEVRLDVFTRDYGQTWAPIVSSKSSE